MAAIAFGTAGFIIIRTMGDSVEQRLGENLELLGEATVMMADWKQEDENVHPGQFYLRDVRRLRQLEHVIAVAPIVSQTYVQAFAGSTNWRPSLFGVDQSYWKTQTPVVLAGRLIGPSDVAARRQVCILGRDAKRSLFGDADAMGKIVRMGNLSFQIIGLLGGIQHQEISSGVFIPITTAQSLFPGLYSIRQIYLRVNDWNKVEAVRDEVMNALTASHKGYEHGIRLVYFPDRVQRVRTLVNIVKLFVYASLVVTFILGKVGLTNVMLAAIQDRTREIGLRKALGARVEIIRLQFLSESVLISLLAGLAGVVVGMGAVEIFKQFFGLEVSNYVMSVSITIDLVFTLSIGVFAGWYPSLQASRLDVVTAMRFE
jgi:putative ABC transport system permease protein